MNEYCGGEGSLTLEEYLAQTQKERKKRTRKYIHRGSCALFYALFSVILYLTTYGMEGAPLYFFGGMAIASICAAGTLLAPPGFGVSQGYYAAACSGSAPISFLVMFIASARGFLAWWTVLLPISLFIFAFILCFALADDKKSRRTLSRTTRLAALTASAAAALIALLGIALSFVPERPGIGIAEYKTRAELVEIYRGELEGLSAEGWSELSADERLALLRTVCKIECASLGITEPPLLSGTLPDTVMGQFMSAGAEEHKGEPVIMLANEALSSSPIVCIMTLLHEIRHAYQYEIVSALDWKNGTVLRSDYFLEARKWRDEQQNYVSGELDYDEYYEQSVEEDARIYSEEGYRVYSPFILNIDSKGEY